MAKRTMRSVVCDIAHDDGADAPAVETVALSVDGRSVELDLCAEHAEEFIDDVEAYLAAGRPAGSSRRGTEGSGGTRPRRPR